MLLTWFFNFINVFNFIHHSQHGIVRIVKINNFIKIQIGYNITTKQEKIPGYFSFYFNQRLRSFPNIVRNSDDLNSHNKLISNLLISEHSFIVFPYISLNFFFAWFFYNHNNIALSWITYFYSNINLFQATQECTRLKACFQLVKAVSGTFYTKDTISILC